MAKKSNKSKSKKPKAVVRAKVKSSSGGKKAAIRKGVTKTASASSRGRRSWLDESGNTPIIDGYARELGTFIDAMADGIIDEKEVKAQESRLAGLMREVEPKLSGELHEQVTRLLCELTAYDIMQFLKLMHDQKPPSKFRG
jgi:hypothetical protein